MRLGRERVSRDFNHKGIRPGGGGIMEKPETEILFAHAHNLEINVSHVYLCSLHLEYPIDTTCRALEYNRQFTFSQRLLMLLSGYLQLKACLLPSSINRGVKVGTKTTHGSMQPS